MTRARRGQAGFALMMAIFIIITLAAIGVYMVTISTGQLEGAAQDEQGTKAYRAARTGIDWGAYQILRNTTGTFATSCDGGSASQNLTFTVAQLSGFRSQVACSLVGTETEGSITVKVYRLTVTACNGSPTSCGTSIGPTYVERQIQLTVTREL